MFNLSGRFYNFYFFILGLLLLFVALAEIVVGFSGLTIKCVLFKLPENFLIWRTIVLFLAGLIYLVGGINLPEIHARSRVVLASIMVWIITGTDIFSLVLTSISGSPDTWFNSWFGFIYSYSPPYVPIIYIFPFTLVCLAYFYGTISVVGEAE